MNEPGKKGRPTKYKPEYNQQAHELCLLGFTDAQLAEHFEVNEDTIHEWKKAHPLFSEALRTGKSPADGKVAAAMFKKATGFKYREVTFEKLVLDEQEDIETEKYKKKVVHKLFPPDAGAGMSWLKNRQKELWRDKIELDLNKLSDEELDRILERLTIKANQK